MKSTPVRDPANDHLLTPQNCALIIIDYQPPQVFTTVSMDRQVMIDNMRALISTAKNFKLPIILSTVNNSNGRNPDTIPQLKEVLGDIPTIDRTSINSWEDEEFVRAVKATGRKKLLIAALWTDACLLFPTLDALKEGFEVFPVVDCVGANSHEGHRAALQRMIHKGAQPVGWNSVACELQRDWARTATVPGFVQTAVDQGGAWGWYLTLEGEIAAYHNYKGGAELRAADKKSTTENRPH
ncbi:hydrolase [Bdellovibrio sp. HCB2-146]|uniref:hydrolase n=1 Tax=Bdellovibrio sp. HCB2-146 TaxID=3394362 RepID=UPI0039BD2475